MTLRFRGRLAPHLFAAVIAAVAAGVCARIAQAALGAPVPWLVAALAAGGAVLLWRYLGVYGRDGVAVDEHGIRALAGGGTIAWDEVRTLRLCAHPHATGGGVALVRYAALERDGGPALAFCDKGPLARHRIVTAHGPLADVAESGLLLALLAERLELPELLPPPAAPTAAAPAAPELPMPAVLDRRVSAGGLCLPALCAGGQRDPPRAPFSTLRTSYGIWPLVAKLGPKLATGVGQLWKAVATGAKTFKLGTAAVSLGAYSLLLSWPSAVALMVMIAWHEYGHVHAMRRCGVPVRGIYFIPFLGGAAVHEAPIPDRAQQAYVALNGPLWGFYLTLVPLVAFFATGQAHPWLAVCAALWAALNLFNLLPILPLDGGRALSSIAFSIHSGLGLALACGTLVAGLALTIATKLGLLALVLAVGALEFATEVAATQRRECLLALQCAPDLEFAWWHRLQALARTVTQGQDTPRALGQEQATFERSRAVLRGRSMSSRQLAVFAAGYVALTAALVGVIAALRHVPGADLIHGLLR
jgi:Zn-dependent protease